MRPQRSAMFAIVVLSPPARGAGAIRDHAAATTHDRTSCTCPVFVEMKKRFSWQHQTSGLVCQLHLG